MPYQPDHGMDYWRDPTLDYTQENPVIAGSNFTEIASEVIENIWVENPHIFDNINAIHFVFFGLPKEEGGHGTVAFNQTYTATGGTVILSNINVTRQPHPQAIPHERLHITGAISGNPNGFNGFRDRGSNRDINAPGLATHYNMTASYDMVDHSNRGIPDLRALYGYQPITSLDKIFFGWIRPEEIQVVNNINSVVNLADVTIPLNETQINSGLRRIAKVMIRENYEGDFDEYFLLEYHNASSYDKSFTNHDEFSSDYGKGILVWHILERTSVYTTYSDQFIDLEAAVPYNGWYGNPIPNDSYPRTYTRPSNWNGIHSGDYDYMDDMQRINKDTWFYPPDGGRNIWETTIIPTPSPHLIGRPYSLRSDFFTDLPIKGIVSNKMSDATRPSTKGWGNLSGTALTHIGLLNMRRVSNYMTVDIFFNYWEGTLMANSTISGNATIGNLTVPSGITLTVNAGANLTFTNASSLIINGTLMANGTTASKISFTAPTKGSWNGIRFNSTSTGSSLNNCIIRNAVDAVNIDNNSPTIQNSFIDDADNVGIIISGTSSYPVISSNYIEADFACIAHYYGGNGNFTSNSFQNAQYGVYSSAGGSPRYDYYSFGRNKFETSIFQDKVKVISGQPWMGMYQYFTQPVSTTYKYINNLGTSTVYATNDYWAGGTSAVYFNGSVDRSSPLGSPPSSPAAGPGWTLSKTTGDDFFAVFNQASILFFDGKFLQAKENFKILTDQFLETEYSSYSLNWYMLASEQLKELANEEDYLKSLRQNKSVHVNTKFCALKWLVQLETRNGTTAKANSLAAEIEAGSKYDREISFELAAGLYAHKGDKKGAEEVLNKLKEKFNDNNTAEAIEFTMYMMGLHEAPSGPIAEELNKDEEKAEMFMQYELLGNYPNPFNPSTTINYSLPYQSSVELTIYDIMGREIKAFNISSQSAGTQSILWDGKNYQGESVSSGIYLYKIRLKSLETKEVFEKTSKLIMLK